jgi:TonB family protein
MVLRRHFVILALATFAPLALAQTAPPSPPQDSPAYQTQLNSLADRLAKELRSKHLKHHQSPKVLVADFVNDQSHQNLLGQQLSDALSSALQSRLSSGQLISRKDFQDRLVAEGLSPADLKDQAALEWHAAQAAANVLLTGRLSPPGEGNSSTLQVQLTDIPDSKALSSDTAQLSLLPDAAKLLAFPEDWPKAARDARCSATVNRRKSAGNSPAQCKYCPAPQFSEAARQQKVQAHVTLEVYIDEQGTPTSAVVLSGAPYGLSDQAVKAVLQWQFNPATRDNQPVASCAPIEVMFRLY